MSEQILINNFSAGWCPSDDAVNGRPNALLQMDNLEIDRNGALISAAKSNNKTEIIIAEIKMEV